MKRILLLSAIWLITTSLVGQLEPSFIQWSQERPLKWTDFQAPTSVYGDTIRAYSHCVIYPTYTYGRSGIHCRVECRFERSKSWAGPDVRQNSKLLSHEQGHFDITEFYARVYRKVLSNTALEVPTISERFKFLTDSISSLCDQRQNLYDSETRFGKDATNQLLWNKQIQADLKSLDSYMDPTVTR